MDSQKYALVLDQLVYNIVIWDGVSPYEYSDRAVFIGDQVCDIGYTYVDGVFYPPVEVIE
jgi:hypothetical protein